jgi:hypothetical protein
MTVGSEQLHIESINRNGTTGHVTVIAYVVETVDGNEVKGVKEVHGLEPLAAERKFSHTGPNMPAWIAAWLQSVKETMIKRHRVRTAAVGELQSLVGKRL